MDDAQRIAQAIYTGFRAYRAHFEEITAAAKHRFEHGDWQAVQNAAENRLAQYKNFLHPLAFSLEGSLAEGAPLWAPTKAAYIELIAGTADAELAETFYNSVYRHLTNDAQVDDREMFVTSSIKATELTSGVRLTKTYSQTKGVNAMVRQILERFEFNVPWRDMDRDIENVLRSLWEERPQIRHTTDVEVEILDSVFYRNKGAYLIGKIKLRDAHWPVVLALGLTEAREIYVDTMISDEDELSIVFSFTRAYFMVATPHPRALVEYLHSLLPNKKISELYASVGLYKHGKTEFYRGFLTHLANSDDKFVIAPGIRGMVMTVFTLPSYQTVFKVIKDRFTPQKSITAEEVREKYQMVKTHDRVGRMADTQEFENLVLPRDRFADALITELETQASERVDISGDQVLIRHAYTERLMTPLNIFVEQAGEAELLNALDEYGNAIKQLAAANIFPGDMLLKNFGITRHGRVVFYDYDEIGSITELNFRKIPEARTEEDELSSQPWYSVAPNDVFPEEFRRFLFGKPRVKQLFNELHGDIFTAELWQRIQDELASGHVTDVFPYRRKRRFPVR